MFKYMKVSRGNVRVSGRRLYGADGWAARELARVAALMTQHEPAGDSSHSTHGTAAAPLTSAAYDVGARVTILLYYFPCLTSYTYSTITLHILYV